VVFVFAQRLPDMVSQGFPCHPEVVGLVIFKLVSVLVAFPRGRCPRGAKTRMPVGAFSEPATRESSPSEDNFGFAKNTIPDSGFEAILRYDIDPVSEPIL
jgi:hypothetical protein